MPRLTLRFFTLASELTFFSPGTPTSMWTVVRFAWLYIRNCHSMYIQGQRYTDVRIKKLCIKERQHNGEGGSF